MHKTLLEALTEQVVLLKLRFPVAEISEKTGYNQSSVSEYLRGKKVLTSKFIDKFCEVYKVDRNLFDFDSNKPLHGVELRKKKAIGEHEEEGLIYVPIAAQAGYTQAYTDPIFISQLERLYIPGLPYKGEKYRYFDVEGDSMLPTLEDGMQVIAQRIDPEHWTGIHNFYIHVIVTSEQILIKRLFRKDSATLVAISDNEDLYPQIMLPLMEVRELWLVKRKLDWKMTPPKKYDITV